MKGKKKKSKPKREREKMKKGNQRKTGTTFHIISPFLLIIRTRKFSGFSLFSIRLHIQSRSDIGFLSEVNLR